MRPISDTSFSVCLRFGTMHELTSAVGGLEHTAAGARAELCGIFPAPYVAL